MVAVICVFFCAFWMGFISPLLASPVVHFEDGKEFNTYYTDSMESKNGPILMLFGGASVDVKRYEGLAHRLLDKLPSGIVVVAKFFAHMPNPLQSKARVKTMLDALEERGWQNPRSQTFLIGHSQGGMMAYKLAESFDLKGLILLGSYLPRTIGLSSPYSLDLYPKPILTLGGELDGLTGIHYMAREYLDAIRYQQQASLDDYSHEVWVLPEINHMQFVDGKHLKGDLQSNNDLFTAHETISNAIHTFVSLQLGSSESEALSLAADQLRQTSKELLAPIYEARALDQDLCLNAQSLISGLEDSESVNLAFEPVKINKFLSFVVSKARITKDSQGSKAVIPYYEENVANLTDVSSFQSLSPETIACKMRSRESIFDALDFAYDGNQDLDCVAANKAIASKTLALLSLQQKQRLEEKGVRLSFELEEQATGIKWLSSFFKFKKIDSNNWVIKTQQLKTKLNTKPESFAGAHYCKLMPASRLMHWALVSALKYD